MNSINLKKTIFILVLAGFQFTCQAQKIETLAFSRDKVGGIRQKLPNNTDTASQINNYSFTDYFLYITAKKGTSISVSRVWIGGVLYKATLSEVQAPVISPGNSRDTLIVKSGKKIFYVQLQRDNEKSKLNEFNEKDIKQNSALLIVDINGKKDLLKVKKFSSLTPIYLQ